MRMGSHTRSVGEPERTANEGRHRQAEQDMDGDPDPEVTDADGVLVGLHAFDIGTIPASVTPPRTWRRAALFIIGAAAAALIGLVVVGASLVGPIRPTSNFNALPFFPGGGPQAGSTEPTTQQATRPAGNRKPSAPQQTPRQPVGQPAPPPVADVSKHTPATDSAPVPAGPTPAATSADLGVSRSGGISVPAPSNTPVTTVAGGPPAVDGGTLINRTQTFFAEVTSNAKAAATLTANTAQSDATAVIQQRYDQVATIKVQGISLDTSSGVTVSLLQVVNKDGTTNTTQTVLRFTLGTDPKIQNPGS
jgi:hypothetical protein